MKDNNGWLAWTDGSADNLRGIASYGIVLVSPEGERVTYGRRLSGRNTSNIAELMAIGLAIKLVPEGGSITVHSDSKYAINSLSRWRATSLSLLKSGGGVHSITQLLWSRQSAAG